jgi:ribosomal protein S18 acetylase RimI-like enzyme
MDDLLLVYEPLPGEALARFLESGVIDHALATTGIAEWHPANFFLKNARGEWLGGCAGMVWGGWLHIRLLWVAAPTRGRGAGTRLMDAAESFAIERGAGNATLETHSFQALDFYRRRGYAVFGELDDYPPGFTKYFLRKRLGAAGGNPPTASDDATQAPP